MNEISHSVNLWMFLTNREGWGRKAGVLAGQKLSEYIASKAAVGVFRVSLTGVKRLDVGFACEALLAVVGQYLRRQAICLVDVADEDLIENLGAAARETGVPVTIWNSDGANVLGGPRTASARHALAYALARPQGRAAEYAKAANISITNASTRLNKLWAAGCLLRTASTAPSGGTEFVYSPIG